MSDHRKLTQEQLLAEAKERFGDDPMKWAFRCPSCKDVATSQDFSDALKEHPRKRRNGEDIIASDIVGQECIGRSLGARDKRQTYSGRGCDWAAYGLFSGPWTIVLPDGREMYAFPLAEATA